MTATNGVGSTRKWAAVPAREQRGDAGSGNGAETHARLGEPQLLHRQGQQRRAVRGHQLHVPLLPGGRRLLRAPLGRDQDPRQPPRAAADLGEPLVPARLDAAGAAGAGQGALLLARLGLPGHQGVAAQRRVEGRRIETLFLDGEDLERASVAKKMSWASKRETTRTEDMAYCLLGIFGVNMPLLYGEGKNAFRRLQREIMHVYPHDHTIYAWGAVGNKGDPWSRQISTVTSKKAVGPLALPSTPPPTPTPGPGGRGSDDDYLLRGLLADSPADFRDSGDFRPWNLTAMFYTQPLQAHGIRGQRRRGLRLELPSYDAPPAWPPSTSGRSRRSPRCASSPTSSCSAAPAPRATRPSASRCSRGGDSSWGRTREVFVGDSIASLKELKTRMRMFYIEPERKVPLESGDIIFGNWDIPPGYIGMMRYAPKGVYCIDYERIMRRTSVTAGRLGGACFTFPPPGEKLGWTVDMDRLGCDAECPGAVAISLVPLHFTTNHQDQDIFSKGIAWYNCNQSDIAPPLGTWIAKPPLEKLEIDISPFPLITVKVKRMPLTRGGFVDVVDISVSARPDSEVLTILSRAETR